MQTQFVRPFSLGIIPNTSVWLRVQDSDIGKATISLSIWRNSSVLSRSRWGNTSKCRAGGQQTIEVRKSVDQLLSFLSSVFYSSSVQSSWSQPSSIISMDRILRLSLLSSTLSESSSLTSRGCLIFFSSRVGCVLSEEWI